MTRPQLWDDAETFVNATEPMNSSLRSVREFARARPAVFLDRDGTILKERHFLLDPKRVKFYEPVAEAIAFLRKAGFLTVLVSNQSGIARGLLTESRLSGIHKTVQAKLGKAGAKLDGIYYCPHLPPEELGGSGDSLRAEGGGLVETQEALTRGLGFRVANNEERRTNNEQGGMGILPMVLHGRDARATERLRGGSSETAAGPEPLRKYLIHCSCRKPKPGLILRAARELRIDLNKSFLIGDSLRDVQAGKAAGVRTLLVLTGNGKKTANGLRLKRGHLSIGRAKPDHIAGNLLSAARWVVKQQT